MGGRPSRWLWLWWISFPLMTSGVVYAMGGIGPAIFALAFMAILIVVTARFYITHAMPGILDAATPASQRRAPLDSFRRSWLRMLSGVALALVITVAGTGFQTATLVIACCGLLILVGGAVALAVMNKPGGRS